MSAHGIGSFMPLDLCGLDCFEDARALLGMKPSVSAQRAAVPDCREDRQKAERSRWRI